MDEARTKKKLKIPRQKALNQLLLLVKKRMWQNTPPKETGSPSISHGLSTTQGPDPVEGSKTHIGQLQEMYPVLSAYLWKAKLWLLQSGLIWQRLDVSAQTKQHGRGFLGGGGNGRGGSPNPGERYHVCWQWCCDTRHLFSRDNQNYTIIA